MNKTEAMKLKKRESTVIFLLILVNIVLFYFLMGKVYLRIDCTQGKKYFISQPTVDLLKKIDNKLVINYYYEKRCKEAQGISQVIQYVDDMLQEYEAKGNGMVDYRREELSFENQNHLEKIAEIEKLGVKKVALSQSEGTESKSTLGFSGIVLTYKGKTSSIGVIFSDAKFEYMLDVEISKLLGLNNGRVGILVSSHEKTLDKDFRYLYQYVTNEYSDAEVIYSPGAIPEDISTLLLVGGETFSEFDMYKLDQFMMNGGKMLMLANGVKLNFQNPYGPPASVTENQVINMLAAYGITINHDLVGDNESYNPVMQRGSIFAERMRYPMWVKVIAENINRKNPIVDEFNEVNMFWPSSITISDELKDKVQPLLKTTNKSWSMAEDFKIDVDSYKYPVQEGKSQYLLACAYEGALKSFFKDRDAPTPPEGTELKGGKISEGNGKLVVIANEDFISNDFLNREDEIYLILNSLDWLTKDGSLIKIRNKGKFSRPLNKVNNLSMLNLYKNLIITFTTVIIPLGFIAAAIGVFTSRRRFRKVLEEQFAEYSEQPQAEETEKVEEEQNGEE
ncbi:MAG: GldG family protein [Spirochaetales bacterium]|nr:GldG family protein [Spirochaetales bacterium]